MSRCAAPVAALLALVLAAGCGSDGDPPTTTAASPPSSSAGSGSTTCEPTPEDALGPFYEPGAPVRDKVGEGYVLAGTVRSADSCDPIPRVSIEFWLVGPDGEYDDAHRATVPSRDGSYRFESNFPVGYEGRPPHIHIRVTLPNEAVFVTQHYPEEGSTRGRFDITIPGA